MFTPKEVFFTRGVGRHKDKLQSFELALRDAQIQNFNLVSVSSILPPHCKLVDREKGRKKLQSGQIVFAVISRNDSNEPHRVVSSAVGVAVPADKSKYGYLSEHHAFGQTEKQAGDYAEDLAATMLASSLGIGFDADKDYDERKDIFMMSGQIVKTKSIAKCVSVEKNGDWTTVVTAAILVP